MFNGSCAFATSFVAQSRPYSVQLHLQKARDLMQVGKAGLNPYVRVRWPYPLQFYSRCVWS